MVKSRRIARTFTVALAVAATGFIGSGVASAAGPTYPIFTGNGKCLVPYGGSSSNGANIVQWDCNGSAAQEWWTDSSDRVRNSNGKCLVPYGGSSSNGANIVQWDCNGAALYLDGSDRSRIRTPSGKCIRPYGNSANNGAYIVQWECAS